MTRPARKHIPIAVKREVVERQGVVCPCGCGEIINFKLNGREIWAKGVHWDHEPALRLRDVNRAGTDYIPPQNNPKYITARCAESHRIKTSGAGKSRKRSQAGTDLGKIVKERRRAREAMPPYHTGMVPFTYDAADKRPKRKIHSRGFQKVHRPMRGRQ